jgi:hypothetical protein
MLTVELKTGNPLCDSPVGPVQRNEDEERHGSISPSMEMVFALVRFRVAELRKVRVIHFAVTR